jgi:hypothetical protein
MKIRRIAWRKRVESMEENRNAHKCLVGKPEGKISLVKYRHRWEDNIKMDLKKETYVEWNHLVQVKGQ